MDLLYKLLVVLHLVGMAMVVGGWLVTVRAPKLSPGMWHGALTQLVTGIALVGLGSAGLAGHEPDTTKITVKLLVTLAVVALIFLGRRTRRTKPGIVHAAGGLALLNVLVAVLW